MAETYSSFRRGLLLALAEEASKFADTPELSHQYDVQTTIRGSGLEYQPGWLRKAVEQLERQGFLKADQVLTGDVDGGMYVELTGEGFEEAERIKAEAADVIIKLDENSNEYAAAIANLRKAVEAVSRANNWPSDDVDEKAQRTAELEAGRRLLEAPQARRSALMTVIVPALKWLVEKFADTAAGLVFTKALEALAALLDLSL